mgnify:CR=1 FL=1
MMVVVSTLALRETLDAFVDSLPHRFVQAGALMITLDCQCIVKQKRKGKKSIVFGGKIVFDS